MMESIEVDFKSPSIKLSAPFQGKHLQCSTIVEQRLAVADNTMNSVLYSRLLDSLHTWRQLEVCFLCLFKKSFCEDISPATSWVKYIVTLYYY